MKTSFLFLFCFLNSVVFAQFENSATAKEKYLPVSRSYSFRGAEQKRTGFEDFISSDGAVTVRLGAMFSRAIHGELMLVKTDYSGYSKFEFIMHEFGIGSEYLWQRDQFMIGPKVSYTFNALLVGARVSGICYTDFTNKDWRFVPEIGITSGGMLSFFYGYAIPLSDYEFSCIGKHRLSVTLTLVGF